MFQRNTLGWGIFSNNLRAYFISPFSLQQKGTSLFWTVGFVKSPSLIVWEWICLSWCMDSQVSRREVSGVSCGGGGDIEELENILLKITGGLLRM